MTSIHNLFSLFKRTFFLAALFCGFHNMANAQARFAVANGNWNSTATWSATSGGAAGASVPVATDAVTIERGFTVTLNTNGSCASLTFNPLIGGTAAISQLSIGAFTLTVSGNVTLNGSAVATTRATKILFTNAAGTLTIGGNLQLGSGAAIANSAIIDMSNGANLASTLNIAGSMTRNTTDGRFTPGTGSTVNYNGTAAQTINLANFTYANLTTNNTNSVTGAVLGAAVTTTNITGNISVNSGLFSTNNLAMTRAASKTLTVALGAIMDAGTTSITMGTTATVTINGTFITANTAGFSGTTTTAIKSTNTPTITLGASSTIEYDAAAAQTVTNRTDYANVTLTGGSKTIGTAAAQTVSLSKTLTINTGATYLGSTWNPILNIGGDFSNSGTFTQGTALVTFNGTVAQTISGSSATTFSNNVTLNNAAGISITTSPTFNGTLTFTSGKITTGVNKVIFGSAATTTGMAAGRYIYGNQEIFFPNAAAPSKTFIIGDATNYTPVLIAFAGTTTGSGSLIASTSAGDDLDINNSGINSALSVNRTWTVTQGTVPVGGFTSYSGTFNFVVGDIDAGANTANFVVRKFNATWATTTAGTRTATSTQATGMTSFGNYQIGEARTITVATNPVNSTICAGTNTTFSSTSTSIPTPTIQWQRGNPGYTNITAVLDNPNTTYSGFTTSTLALTGSETPINGYLYRAVFTNINGTATSTAATLTVNASPTITTQPSNQTVCTSANATFTVATSAGTPTYQWQMSADNNTWVNTANGTPTGVTYTNPTTATLTVNGTSFVSLYYYRCVVTAGICSRNSNSATLTINAVPAAAGTITGSAIICPGQNGVAYSVPAISGATSYTWAYSGTGFSIASGAGTNSITANFSAAVTAGNLTVYGVSPCGNGVISPNFSITLTNTPPGAAGTITGTSAVCVGQVGVAYSVAAITNATSYVWTYSGTGFSITSGSGTRSIVANFSISATSGNLTVYGTNGCGTGTVSPNYAITTSVCLPHNNCSNCHIFHNAPGGAITAVNGNPNLCISCHNPAGWAYLKPFDNSMKAVPGVSGTSHAWSKPSINATYGTNRTTNSQMLMRLPGDSIICSTCHNQHNPNTNNPFLRASNTGDALCKDCHSARNIMRYADNPANKGSHPVGVAYNSADPRFKTTPTAPIQLVGTNVECSSCHGGSGTNGIHRAATTDGYLLRQTNNNAICTGCHIDVAPRRTLIHEGQLCLSCHYAHKTGSANILLIRDTISTPNSGLKPVVFTANGTPGNYAVGAAPFNGICEVCHTLTDHYTNTTAGTADARHVPAPQKCVNCHPHSVAFAAQANCFDCHNMVQDKPLVGPVGGRRQIVDNTGNGLGTGGDFKRTSHHVSGSIPNVSDCILCHYMGDHKKGQVKLLDPDQGYLSVYTYDPLNPVGIENFCLNCHDANGAGGDVTPFSDNVTVPLVDSTMWVSSSHKTGNTCLSCHDNGHGSNKSNLLAPFSYAGPGTGTDLQNEEEGFCLTCHGAGGVATVKVHLAFSSYTNTTTNFYKHDPNSTYRKHNKSENTGAAFSGANRHIECVDCHNPHGVKAGTATAPTLLPTMTGARGVEPTYAGAGAPIGFTWQNSVTQEYQVCFKCHSSFTTLSSYLPGGWNQTAVVADGLRKLTTGGTNGQVADSRDMAQEYNPNNTSFHPVMAAGKNLNINAGTFQAGWSYTSRVYCSSCHNNPNSATVGQGRGPHGSINLHILDGTVTAAANYKTAHNTGSVANSSQVCQKCHQTGSYISGNTNSRFGFHQYHMNSPVTAECYVCHDTHGSEQFHLMNFNRNEVSCNITWIAPGTGSQNAFAHVAGTGQTLCNINCHGVSHGNGKPYNPGY